MRRLLAGFVGAVLGLHPGSAHASSAWGSAAYGDPPGWCTNFSDMWVATVVTNDPHVGTNPERNTFYGFHPNPGYDDWFGYFYGDFRGKPGDASGWVKLLHENYPDHYHWNFADNGWSVHGHAKEYIAYYNWTFGGQCGISDYGSASPPPFMADMYGYPVVDIYVDSKPPNAPQPRVTDMTTTSVTFTWDPVADQGDGAGKDFFKSGMGHYSSWLTQGTSPKHMQEASTQAPRILTQPKMKSREIACLHVIAFDKVSNKTAERVTCAGPLLPPPMPDWSANPSVVMGNPAALGLVGLDSWFWLAPRPSAMTIDETSEGIGYEVSATPIGAGWDFGDGVTAVFPDSSGYGRAYPEMSSVVHTYEAHSQTGYDVRSSVRYAVSWTASIGGHAVGPYSLGAVDVDAKPMLYSVEQAQPELVSARQDADHPVTPTMTTAMTGPAGGVTRYWA